MLKKTVLIFVAFLFWIPCFAELHIGTIRFEGNKSISESKLAATIYSKNGAIYDQQVINDDAKRIADLYKNKGLLHVRVPAPQIITASPENIDVIFLIQEGNEQNIEQIFVQGNRYLSCEKIAADLNLRNIPLSQLSAKMKVLREYYADNSFLFASVKLDSLVQKNAAYLAYLEVAEGSFCEFDEYKFVGNKVTQDETILRISQIENIKKITPAVLQNAAENLRSKDYIKACEIIPLNGKQLLFQIEEDRMSRIAGVLGYDNSQAGKNKFAGYLNVEFLNLSGTDRSLALNWERLVTDQTTVEMAYHESGFRRFPLEADFSLQREEVDSTYIRTQFHTDIYVHNLSNKYGLYISFDEIYPGSRRPRTVESASYRKVGAFWDFSAVNYAKNPTGGYAYYLKYYYIFNKVDHKNVTKQAAELEYEIYHKIRPKLVLAAKINVDVIENKKLNYLEYFALGGYQSLRGFEENQFQGYRLGWTNLELRLLTSRNSRLFLFTDYGYVENSEYTMNDLFGFGFGMNMQTKVGLLGITYGFSYQNGELRNPLDGIIHFGIESKL